MKRFIILISLIISCSMAMSQRYADIGVIGGVSYYLGDLNPIMPFSQISPGYGGIYRYSLNYHHAFRVTVLYNKLKGKAANYDWYPNSSQDFNATLIDGAVNYEFNFLKYRTTDTKYIFSPYLTLGVGYAFYLASSVGTAPHMIFPYGAGAKVNINERLSAGVEWTIRKTLTDNIDGITNFTVNTSETPTFNNTDWYTFTGLFITYKFFKFSDKCPTYFDD